MELICKISQQYPLQTRDYTDRNGNPQTFKAVGFELASGADSFYVELTGDAASSCGLFSKTDYYKVDLSARAETWIDNNGQDRHATRFYINRIAKL